MIKSKLVFIILFLLQFNIEAVAQLVIPIGSGLQEKIVDNTFYTPHVVKNDSLYFIGGQFDFADSVDCNNIIIWDGDKFVEAGDGFDFPIDEIVVFKNKVIVQRGSRLYYWKENEWIEYETQILNYYSIKGIKVLNDNLYVFGHNNLILNEGDDGSPLVCFDGDKWTYIHINPGSFWSESIVDIDYWKNQLVISPIYGYAPLIIDSIGETIITDGPKFEGNLFAYNDLLFLHAFNKGIYGYQNNKWNLVADFNIDIGEFFVLEDQVYFGTTNDGTFKYTSEGIFESITDIEMGIYEIATISEDKYLIVGRLSYSSNYEKELNNIAILDYGLPVVDLVIDKDTICENEYVFFQAVDDDMTMSYDWDLEGGTPSYSGIKYPVAKYSKPGIYPISLNVKNMLGSLPEINKSIVVKSGCHIDRMDRYDNVWVFGYHNSFKKTIAGLDFSNKEFNISAYNSSFSLNGLSNSISDRQGDLLFYSNGVKIANFENEIIEGSEGFNTDKYIEKWGENANQARQGMLTIPSKENDDIYYLFHTPIDLVGENNRTLPTRLSMSILDFSYNEGKGKMIVKDLPIINDTLHLFTMQATRHCNGEDWWIIIGESESENYYSVLVKPNGDTEVTKHSLGIILETHVTQTVFSPHGNKFALSQKKSQETYLWDFDNCNGQLSNLIILKPEMHEDYDEPRGCSFSPNSRFLYVSSYFWLRQYDMCSDDIKLSEELVGEWDGTYDWIYPASFAKQAMAPNDKIYISSLAPARLLSIIHSPNEKGLNCDFKQHDIRCLEHTHFDNILPDFPHYRIPINEYNCDSLTLNIKQQIKSTIKINMYPNPTNSNINFEFKNMKPRDFYNIEIYSSIGRLVKTVKLNSKNPLNISELPKGNYFVRVWTSNIHYITKQIMVQ